MRMHHSFLVAGVLALSAVVDSSSPTLTAQTVSNSGSPFAAQQQLGVRFHRLWLGTANSHTGWERGLWLRGPILAADYAQRAAFVRFLRTELLAYIASERTVIYPIADIVLGGSQDLTSAAISDSHVIEGLVERLEAAASSPDARGFQANAYALSVVVNDFFTKDRGLIEQVLALGPRLDATPAAIAGR